VNLTLAFNAVRTFPGLEVKNSYVASQSFQADRDAQLALDWDVSAVLSGGVLSLKILEGGKAIAPEIIEATFGRATSVTQDQSPAFAFTGTALVADVETAGGNWNLRLKARSADGALFQQRIIVEVRP
jgi:nitrogen fixation protein FixH